MANDALLKLMMKGGKPVHDTATELVLVIVAVVILAMAVFVIFKPQITLPSSPLGKAFDYLGCTDKDFGLSYETAALCYSIHNDNEQPISDTCISNDNVLEMYCKDQQCLAKPQSCSEYCMAAHRSAGYCSEGKCVCG